MTRKPAPGAQARSGVALFILTLTILITLVAFAPLNGVGQPSEQSTHPVARLRAKGSVSGSSQPSSPLFLPAVSYDLRHELGASSVSVADVNGDGKPDLLVAAGGSSVAVLLGNGDGTFRTPVTFGSGGFNAQSLAVADVNGDGKLDLVVANLCVTGRDCSKDGAVGVLLGNGDGTFQLAVAYDSGGSDTQSVAVADVNGDGKPDIVVANCGPSGINTSCPSGGEGSLGVLLGNGDGTFSPVVTYDSGERDAESVAVADVNEDGKPDIVAVNLGNNTLGVLLGNGDGTFRPAVPYASGGVNSVSVAISDLNGDGKPDLVVASLCGTDSQCNVLNHGTAGVLLGNGDGTFRAAVSYDSGARGAQFVVAADVNGDGKPDLIVTNECVDAKCSAGSVGVLLGNGDGTFQAAVSYNPGGPSPRSAAVADVNADSQPDLLVANAGRCSGSTSGCVGVLLHASASQNATTTTLASSLDPSFVGQAVAFTSTVSSSLGPPPNGEIITFNNGSVVLGTGSLSGGSASLTTSSLPVGSSTITASYPGDANFGASTSPALQQVVNPTSKFATSAALASSLNPSTYEQKVTWTAMVTSSGSITPTGKVNFRWSIYTIGAATLNRSGVATLTKSNLNADAYPLTAVYEGDASNLGSASAVLNQVVLETTSSATLTSSPNPSTQGQAVTFTATIKSPTVRPTGPVTFTAGKTVLGTAQLSRGKATLTTSSLPAGTSVVTVTYEGDSNIARSTASVTQVVQ
jgi:hypothetical protein